MLLHASWLALLALSMTTTAREYCRDVRCAHASSLDTVVYSLTSHNLTVHASAVQAEHDKSGACTPPSSDYPNFLTLGSYYHNLQIDNVKLNMLADFQGSTIWVCNAWWTAEQPADKIICGCHRFSQ